MYINCKQVVKAYRVGGHEIVALRGIDFTMAQGEMVAIIGPSGAGKSSLMNLLGGLDTPTAGKLTVNGQDLLAMNGRKLAEYRLRQVGFVWQQVERNLFPHRTALANVTLPMMLAGVPVWRRRKRACELLDAVGLTEHMHKKPAQLSGGQQQRIAIAVALANQPQLLLADEPTGALDRQTAVQIMDLITELRAAYGLTVLMVTHDMAMAAYADRVLTLRDGALGQDLTNFQDPAGSKVDDQGRIRLPSAVKSYLEGADRIAVEIRPEGVLLRPEVDEDDDTQLMLQDMLPQRDKKGWLRRILRRGKTHKQGESE
ncbi:MAG: ABC transporter [Phototrophicales bacterium]|nr:MAG: ABC transporter [Phototrophicales bacterium]